LPTQFYKRVDDKSTAGLDEDSNRFTAMGH
jgi:hypothetical protein